MQCAAMIGFEQAMYAVMEGDPTPTVDVCVTVGNGRVANSLTVPINALPTSTATGQGSMFSAYLELLEGEYKRLWAFLFLLSIFTAEGEDYELSDPAEIVIPANMARGCLTVTILQSAVVEGEEEIRLAIDSTAVNATVVDAETTIVIAPDGGKTL